MKHYKSICDYCTAINIAPPKQPYFDIRKFEENMPSIITKVPPFKHEFYAIAIKKKGSGTPISGHHTNFPKGVTVFFNTPYQILSWDILPDWKGYYLMFSNDFVVQSKHLQNLLSEFPFLKIDNAVPIEIRDNEAKKLLNIYNSIYDEQQDLKDDSLPMIESQILVILNLIKRFFFDRNKNRNIKIASKKADLTLLSRFQSMIEKSFYYAEKNASIQSPTWYAEQLAVHPNHLNATVKQITGSTAKEMISKHVLFLAKSRLIQTDMSIKEIAYSLNFNAPNNFSIFFKKNMGQTPSSFRNSKIL